jgi:SpoVK/Ycf46/Vps4 family AAA+-type ATPase
VAEYLERPLIALRVTEFMETRNRSYEAGVSQILKTADRLGAIVLLDEADVILEERSFEDVGRNGIVSGELKDLLVVDLY